jgi:hypothetical protein
VAEPTTAEPCADCARKDAVYDAAIRDFQRVMDEAEAAAPRAATEPTLTELRTWIDTNAKSRGIGGGYVVDVHDLEAFLGTRNPERGTAR